MAEHDETTFKGNAPVEWKCRNCGFIHHHDTAPKICPICQHPQVYFVRIYIEDEAD